MFCENCGSNVPDGTKFCPKCGNKEFDMDIFVEMLCYQANKSETDKIS